ncbi:unnamed protein product [Allacma fusca]|uniref:MARVEL domain-containing protein n=1 Tax=Allacma fusca TaxID=39272 RepID=A0A8J2PGT5_9HEXA|nr:unnamed protein product [Allacma fusca]
MDPETGFPVTHTTTTTTTSTSVVTTLRFDPTYTRSLPGTLKCAQMVLNLIGFICVAVARYSTWTVASWFSFVAMGGLFITLFLFVFFLYHIIEKLYFIPWLLVEWVYCALWTFFYFTAATACASYGGYDSAFAAAAFFGYVAMLLYGFDAYLKYISWRAGEIAQGDRIVNKTTTTTSSPAAY